VSDLAADLTAQVRSGVARIQERIAAAGAEPERVAIVAVTKGQSPAAVRAAEAAGLLDVGENYAPELVSKAAALEAKGPPPAVRWHFIGQLQRNKVRSVAHLVTVWQSVDRLTLGAELAKRAPGASVLLQVNLTDDDARGGARPAMVRGLLDGLRDLGLNVQGLMAVGPHGDPDATRAGFRTVRDLADRLALPERSMGMSGDLEIAVQEGATMVRVGTALFGARPRVGRPAVEN
jgi:pyridoxal phosphate enzyme (YggS family)